MEEAYHLVCHDCPVEGIYRDRDGAETARTRHERATDHRLSLADVAAGSVATVGDADSRA